MILARIRTLLYIGVPTAALIGGWMACGWYRDAQALDDYDRALEATKTLYQQALSDYAAEYEAEVQKSLTLEKQNRDLRETVAGLREEIDHVTFTPPVVDGCKSHPVSSAEFVGLYARAARGGSAEDRAGDPSGVSPRDD